MKSETYNPFKVQKRIVSKFLLLPFKDNGKWYFLKRVLMVQILLPVPVLFGFDWYNSHIATIDDIINI